MKRVDENGVRWRPIHGYQNRYWISEKGEVWSEFSKKCLKLREGREGYYYCKLWMNQKHKTVKAHRLVAIYFLNRPRNCNVVNHKDGNKLNNDKRNLEWTTTLGNNLHAIREGLKQRKVDDCLGMTMATLYATGNYTYDTLAEKYNIGSTTIGTAVNRYGN